MPDACARAFSLPSPWRGAPSSGCADVAEVEFNPDSVHIPGKDELRAAVRQHDILFCLLQDRVDARGDRGQSRTCGMIASMKITPSDIDVAAATARRIPVTVIPPIVTEATADIHFALLLAVARRLVEGDRLLRSGVFPGAQSIAPGRRRRHRAR